MYITRRKDEFLGRFNKIDKEILNTNPASSSRFSNCYMCGVFEVLYTAPHIKTLYYKYGFFNNIYFLFFRKIALPITLVILLFVVFIVMKKRGNLKRLKEKFGGNRIAKSGSYNTNKSIIQIVIPTQGRSSWST